MSYSELREFLNGALAVAGVTCVLAGVAMISIPAALIVAGLMAITAAWLGGL